MIRLTDKLRQLETLYRLYEELTAEMEVACAKGCAECCTRNVVLTTLEGYRLAEHLAENQPDIFETLRAEIESPRFIPKMTTNRLVKFCREGREPPAEVMAPSDTRCSMLSGSVCAVYPFRPFGCRCMISQTRCADTGHAKMDDFTVTVNTVFLQFIEHIDAEGCSGNLLDILLLFESESSRRYRQGQHICSAPSLIANTPIPMVMIPSEHQRRLGPWIPVIQRALIPRSPSADGSI